MNDIPIRIVGATVRPMGGASPGAHNARSGWSERRGLLLTLRDSRGNCGTGEASPLPGYTIDDLPAVERTLSSIDWTRLPAIPRLSLALSWIREVVSTLPKDTPAASCAVDAALLDLISRGSGVSMLDLFGAHLSSVPVAHLLHAEEAEAALGNADRLVASGARTLKVKIGRSNEFEAELSFLRALRTRVGDDVKLRMDANRGLGGSELAHRLRLLTELSPELIEEPALPEEMMALDRCPSVVGLDESLFVEAEDCIRSRCAPGTFVVLKPMALGGMLRCLDLAQMATKAGGRVVVTHTFDGPLGWSVAAALALLTHEPEVAAGLAPHAGLSAWPQRELAGLRGHRIHATSALGWGIPWA